jgi:hypothetical protein
MIHPSYPPPATRFPPRIIFFKINMVNNIIARRRWRCVGPRLLDSSLHPLCWRRSRLPSENRKKTRRNYSSATPSLPDRRCHQENQTAEEPRSRQNLRDCPNTARTWSTDLRRPLQIFWALNLQASELAIKFSPLSDSYSSSGSPFRTGHKNYDTVTSKNFTL